MRISILLIALFLVCINIVVGTRTGITGPAVTIAKVAQGQNSIWILDVNGFIKTSPKSSISWSNKNLPNSLIAIDVGVGTNDDAFAVDQNGVGWAIKAGFSTWVELSAPEGMTLLRGYSYSSDAMVFLGDTTNSVYKLISSTWTKIIDGSTIPMFDVAIAQDGSIHTLDSYGTRYLYSGTTLSTVETGRTYCQLAVSTSASDMVAVDAAFPLIDYKKISGTMTQIDTGLQYLSIYDGNVIASLTSSLYIVT